MNDVMSLHNGEVASFKLSATGLEVLGEPTFEQWVEYGKVMYRYNESLHFAIGDWLNYGEMRWKESYREAIELTGFDYQTLRNDKWVAFRIGLSRRRDSLTFEHHKEVARLPEEEQEELLAYAEENHLTRNDFRKVVQQQTMQHKPKTEKSADTPSTASQDAEQIRSYAETLMIWLGDLDMSLLHTDERERLKKTLLELERKIDATILFTQDYEQ